MQSLIKFENNHVFFDFETKPNQKIKIIGSYDDPYFCGKDICTILEYFDIKQALQKNVKPKHKKNLQTIIDEVDVCQTSTSTIGIPSSKPSYNEGKSVYVSEPGLYSLIMKSRTSFAETFQDFVYEQILPSIRKKGKFQLEQTIALKDDKIDELTVLVRQMDIRSKEMMNELLQKNNELLENVHDLKDQNNELLSRNDELLENVEDLKSTSTQQTKQLETVQTKLGIAVETRAPLPKSFSKIERFLLLKRSQKRNGLQPEYQYYTIRAQETTAKQSLKTQGTMYNIVVLLDLNCHPNSRTLYIRIKDELSKKKVVCSYNNISIEKSEIDEAALIECMRKIDGQKRDV
jgi:prophage antirepressor-like protein